MTAWEAMTVENQATSAAQADETVVPATEAEQATGAVAETADEAGSDDAGSGEEVQTEGKDEGQDDDKAREFRRLKRRNEKLLQERAVERAAREKAEAELQRLNSERESGEEGKKPQDDPKAIAAVMRQAERAAERLTKVNAEGKKFSDFDVAVRELVEELGPQIDQRGIPSPLMDAVLDSDLATEVLYHLGKNPEVAAELSGLSPTRLGRRIAQIESDLAAKAKPKPSAAAKPLAPVKPSAALVVDDSKLSDSQWLAARRKARYG